MSNLEVRIEVYGRVQGVGFRDYIKNNAEKLNLTGFVRNQPDGSVLIVAQGKKEDIKKFVSVAQKGSFLANIGGFSYYYLDSEEKFNDFKIYREGNLLSDQKKSFLNLGRNIFGKTAIPTHIAIIPDGNRRWAKDKGMDTINGVKEGGSYDHMKSLIEEAKSRGVKYFSIWGFSTENWKRPKKEIDTVFSIIHKDIENFRRDAKSEGMRFRHLGRKDRLPKEIAEKLAELEEETKDNDSFFVQLCLDYGGRDEILRAVEKIIKSGKKNISESMFSEFLDSYDIPDPDLVIRTSGEFRVSGFMPFQSTYSEFYFTEKYFPDFKADDLRKSIVFYGMRKRRFGQ